MSDTNHPFPLLLVLVENSSSEAVETRGLLDSTTVGQWVSVDDLQPFSNYSVAVRACNSQGCVESPAVPVSLPPGGRQLQRHHTET